MTWKLIRSAMHLDIKHPKIDHLVINGAKIDNADKIAYSFNNYFINIANDFANRLQIHLARLMITCHLLT
jgi:predicted metalloenzyme YecM